MEYMNSFVNPIILIVGNTHFRSKFILMLKRPFVCFNSTKSHAISNQQRIGPNQSRVSAAVRPNLTNETSANFRFNGAKRLSKNSILM